MLTNLKNELQNYGLNGSNIKYFEEVNPGLLDYLDLIPDNKIKTELLPDGVVENNGHPLLFFIDGTKLTGTGDVNTKFNKLRRILACRGDQTYLAEVLPGLLRVIPVSLTSHDSIWKEYRPESNEALTFYSRLSSGYQDGLGKSDPTDYVFNEMFLLLKDTAERLEALELSKSNIVSLLGRALFFRFLIDRKIINQINLKSISPSATSLWACFDNFENTYNTNRWLDQTFNGEFLPLAEGGSIRFFQSLPSETFTHLCAIIRDFKPVGNEGYQSRLDWGDFHFAHVPVGLLSQVYEAFCWRWASDEAKKTSVYYTPRKIASILVDEAFDGLTNPDQAKILDPACGGGVFLVLAFRRLYQERWKATNRPDTKVIRSILEKQITGFDISTSALKLTALALYLTAIELDPLPIPPEKLKFNKLSGKVLFSQRREQDQQTGPVIGSLGEHVDKKFNGQYDLVLSNPPWTSLSKKEYPQVTSDFTTISRDIIQRRSNSIVASSYINPDNSPELPFLWRSTDWCKPGGRIAMALPARILFKQGKSPGNAREKVFRLIEITGIINGSNLSDTEVWPKMSQPFMLLFAKNQCPLDSHSFSFITLHYDTLLNGKGEMRIDSKSAQSVELSAILDNPWLLKTLAIGTQLDVEIIRKIKASTKTTLNNYWNKELGMVSSNGYKIAKNQEQRDAGFLKGLPNLDVKQKQRFKFKFSVTPECLPKFCEETLFQPREEAIYLDPLVLVNVIPGESRKDGRALLSFSKLAYNESFYGYSASGRTDGDLLVRYLHLFVHSNIWAHYTLAVSAEFGTERRKFHKRDLDDCPIVPLSELDEKDLFSIKQMSDRLLKNDLTVFTEIDTFFAKLFKLNKHDLEAINDTLEVSMPYRRSRIQACNFPTLLEKEKFRSRLETVLNPFFNVINKEITVVFWKQPSNQNERSAFSMMLISEKGKPILGPDKYFRDLLVKLADETGTTCIIQEVQGGLLIGLLEQYRYWTLSRARLLGAEIVRQYMDSFDNQGQN
jgi:type I restriction-modification system DNA methylase subunit